MQLKKINPGLQKALVENGLTEANELQQTTFSVIKSGVDVVIQSPKGSGKTVTAVINVIQKLKEPFEQSPRALMIVPEKEDVLYLAETFQNIAKYNNLRIFAVHDKTDIDEEKNRISLGIDVLIGTPGKLNSLFSGAGFDVNRLQIIVLDDLDVLLKNRYESVINRLFESISKGQKVFLYSDITEKTDFFLEKWAEDAVFFEFDEEESE